MTGRQLSGPGRRVLLGMVALGLLLAGLGGAAPALAQAPYLVLSSSAAPTNLPPGGEGKILVTASNLGDAVMNVEKTPITITDKLPPGLTATSVTGTAANSISKVLECASSSAEASCTDSKFPVLPSTGLKLLIKVKVDAKLPSGSSLVNEIKATGGEAPAASVGQRVKIDENAAPFGVEKYELKPEEESGSPSDQAGAHPFQLTTTFDLNQTATEEPVALPKNLQFNLPAGLIGNPIAIPQCNQADFNTIVEPGPANLCAPETAIGVAEVTIAEPLIFGEHPSTETVPVFNLEPSPGEPALLGLMALRVPIVIHTAVRTGSDYGVVVTAKNTPQTSGVITSRVTIWGVPGDPRHNVSRGWECAAGGVNNPPFFPTCSEQKQPPEVPFLSLPTSCGTPLEAPMRAQSWVPGAQYGPPVESEFQESLKGCESLQFNPSLELSPETEAGKGPCSTFGQEPGYVPSCPGSTPAGLGVTVRVPQHETPSGLAESTVKTTTVTMPEGMQLNAGAANGLDVCSALGIGLEPGFAEDTQTENNHFSPNPPKCPEPAKVGTVSIKSPDLKNRLTGSVYLAREHTNPFEAPLVIYLVAEDKTSGVVVKLAGKVTPDPVTGRLVSTFENTPKVPFEEFNLKFFQGPRASLTTPALCGTYATETMDTPWSTGTPVALAPSSFNIVSGPGGGPCSSNPQPFAPPVQAGSSNTQAGGFTPFTLTINRPDGQQALQRLTMHLPTGLAAMLSSVTLCQEPQVARNECPPTSEIGRAIASSGLGSEPFTLPGRVFITGPYKGQTVPAGTPPAPFGLSVVTPAVAGPFNLGVVTVRSRIDVDRDTAAVTVTSDPFPTIIKGAPVQLKQINVETFAQLPNGKGFQFNPTNCNPLSITGALGGSQGASFPFSYPFKVNNCASLPFKPTFEVSTEAKTSKAFGASLTVKVASTKGQANIGKTVVILPKALPSRLTTIQKACLAAAFEANPASCPEGSNIGIAIVHTPVLKNPLSGPAYLVSHGAAEFPDVEFVLQGEGITLVLDGKTNIHNSITSSRFETLPDAPVETFETVLPEGPHSALAANGNLCTQQLIMPTTITGQNGAVIKQETKIKVTGCPPKRRAALTRAQKLKRALKACRKKKNRHKRSVCEKQARRKYGATARRKSGAKKR